MASVRSEFEDSHLQEQASGEMQLARKAGCISPDQMISPAVTDWKFKERMWHHFSISAMHKTICLRAEMKVSNGMNKLAYLMPDIGESSVSP
jgi:hypothetical protein